jgi:hypothetical protein
MAVKTMFKHTSASLLTLSYLQMRFLIMVFKKWFSKGYVVNNRQKIAILNMNAGTFVYSNIYKQLLLILFCLFLSVIDVKSLEKFMPMNPI